MITSNKGDIDFKSALSLTEFNCSNSVGDSIVTQKKNE